MIQFMCIRCVLLFWLVRCFHQQRALSGIAGLQRAVRSALALFAFVCVCVCVSQEERIDR